MNTDLKLITKTLAKRLANFLSNIIHESQKCIPGRQITENIHLVQDLIDVIIREDWNAAYIMLDQEKAFDRISHKFMLKTLEKFCLGKISLNGLRLYIKM